VSQGRATVGSACASLYVALQRMEQVKHIRMSISRPGMSDIQIEFKDKCRAEDFPGIDKELRRKIADMKPKLPPGADPGNIDAAQ